MTKKKNFFKKNKLLLGALASAGLIGGIYGLEYMNRDDYEGDLKASEIKDKSN